MGAGVDGGVRITAGTIVVSGTTTTGGGGGDEEERAMAGSGGCDGIDVTTGEVSIGSLSLSSSSSSSVDEKRSVLLNGITSKANKLH